MDGTDRELAKLVSLMKADIAFYEATRSREQDIAVAAVLDELILERRLAVAALDPEFEILMQEKGLL